MARQYTIVEARESLARIVDQAEAGAEVRLTRRGKPVAVVVGARQLERLRGGTPDFSAAYQAFVKRFPLDEVGLEPHFAETTRDKGTGRKVSL